jgi:hypothetical protein
MVETDMWELLVYIYIYLCVCVLELWMCVDGKIVLTYMCNNRGMMR